MEALGVMIGFLILGSIATAVGFSAGFLSIQSLLAGGILMPFIGGYIVTFIALFLGKWIGGYIGLKTA